MKPKTGLYQATGIKKCKRRRNALAKKQAHLITCTVVLYEKGGKFNKLVTGCY